MTILSIELSPSFTNPLSQLISGEHVRPRVSAALIGCAIAVGAVAGTKTGSYLFLAYWVLLVAGFLMSQKSIRPRWVLASMAVIIASMWIASLVVYLRGDFLWAINLRFAILVTPMPLFFFARPSKEVFNWIAGAALGQAVLVSYQGLLLREYRPSALIESPNPSAALMAIALMYLMTTRFWWLSSVLLVGIAINGSRLALGVAIILSVVMAATRRVSWRKFAVVTVIAALVTAPSWSLLAQDLRLAPKSCSGCVTVGPLEYVRSKSTSDINRRLTIEQPASVAPHGAVSFGEGPIHNVPMRIATELGIIAAIAWLAVTLWGLMARQRLTVAWFAILGVALVGMLDYYVFIGPLAGMWWLFLGIRANESKSRFCSKAMKKRPHRMPVERSLAIQTPYTIAGYMKTPL